MKIQAIKPANGFTLIELLVVVLIIGILAAVALPQYQLAVLRSRLAGAKVRAHEIIDAQRVYYLAHGTYAANLQELDITPPSSCLFDGAYIYCYVDANVYIQWHIAGQFNYCIARSSDLENILNKTCQKDTGASAASTCRESDGWCSWRYSYKL